MFLRVRKVVFFLIMVLVSLTVYLDINLCLWCYGMLALVWFKREDILVFLYSKYEVNVQERIDLIESKDLFKLIKATVKMNGLDKINPEKSELVLYV